MYYENAHWVFGGTYFCNQNDNQEASPLDSFPVQVQVQALAQALMILSQFQIHFCPLMVQVKYWEQE